MVNRAYLDMILDDEAGLVGLALSRPGFWARLWRAVMRGVALW